MIDVSKLKRLLCFESQHQSQRNEKSLVQFDYEKAVSNYLGTQSTFNAAEVVACLVFVSIGSEFTWHGHSCLITGSINSTAVSCICNDFTAVGYVDKARASQLSARVLETEHGCLERGSRRTQNHKTSLMVSLYICVSV